MTLRPCSEVWFKRSLPWPLGSSRVLMSQTKCVYPRMFLVSQTIVICHVLNLDSLCLQRDSHLSWSFNITLWICQTSQLVEIMFRTCKPRQPAGISVALRVTHHVSPEKPHCPSEKCHRCWWTASWDIMVLLRYKTPSRQLSNHVFQDSQLV